MTLRHAFETIYKPRNLRFASKETIRLWNISLRMFTRFLKRDANVDDLTDENLTAFCMWRRSYVAAATVNRDLASLLALWRYLNRRGILKHWPDVQLEPEPARVPVAWTEEEFTRLIATAKKMRGMIGPVPAARWWPAILLLCFDSGERIGAVMAVKWGDMDLSGRWVIFRAETRKGRDQDSAVRIATDTVAAVSLLPKSSETVFPWPFAKAYLWQRYGKLLERADLPSDRRRKFHCIRRTVASHAEAAGGNATALLRHASRKNTLAYLDPRIATPQQAIDLLWRPT